MNENEQTFDEWIGGIIENGFKIVSAIQDEIEIEPNSDKNIQFPLNVPNGYKFGAYRQISINSPESGGEAFRKVIVRQFGSAGNGTKANVSLYNLSNEIVKAKVEVVVLFMKVV